MSQEQPQRPGVEEAVKYGDVFAVSGQLASKPIAPQDAAALQSAENIVLGQTPHGGPASVMQSAADVNEQRGFVSHQDMTDAVKDQGATVAEADLGGYRIITEAVGGQVVARYGMPTKAEEKAAQPASRSEAESDAAAIQAAEVRATGLGHVVPGGLAAEAQSAAAYNARTTRDEEKAKLGDILADATLKLTGDKAATREDAEGVIYAEIRNKGDMATQPGGVAASVAAAARLNQEK